MDFDAETLNRINKYAWYLYHKNYWRILPYDHEDIRQEICCKLIEKYDGTRPIEGHIVFAGSKVVADMGRALHGRDHSVQWAELPDWEMDKTNGYDRADHEIDVWRITKNIKKARDKEILARYFLNGESQVEIGDRLGYTGSMINKIIKRVCMEVA